MTGDRITVQSLAGTLAEGMKTSNHFSASKVVRLTANNKLM
ncbi:unnamed protein product, partial [Rotaria socialis]